MEPRKAISKKTFVSEEEINVARQDRIVNIDQWKCGCDKLMATFAESFC